MARLIEKTAWLALLVALAAGCRTTSEPIVTREYGCPPVLHATLGTMHNVSVSGEFWFGSIPAEPDLDLAERRGIKTVIDISGPSETPEYDVAAACKSLGLRFVAIDLECRDCLDDVLVDRVLDELRAAHGEPLLLFCANGSRAAMVFAIHRCIDDGVAIEQALTEARRAGMKPGDSENFVKRQVERLTKAGVARAVRASSPYPAHLVPRG